MTGYRKRGVNMAKGGINIDYNLCKGCGPCVEFCNQDCITMTMEKLTAAGQPQASFSKPENCNACCICAWLCPDFAIEVYKYVEASV